MTPEQAIRHFSDAFNAKGLDAAVGLWHPDIEYEEAFDFPGAGTYRGREAVVARFREYLDALGIDRGEIERVVERGDRAAWAVRFSGRSHEGVPHAHTWGYVGRFADGMLIESRAYYEASDAFDAL